jgi:phage gp46-like protein
MMLDQPLWQGVYKGMIDDAGVVVQGDIALIHGVFDGYADVQLAESERDLLADLGLETAVLISLFSNRRENDEKLLPGNSNDKGGWWATQFQDFEYGSRLWLLRRSKNVNNVLPLAEQYVKEALQWMIDQNVAKQINVSAAFDDYQTIMLSIQIYRPEISDKGEFTYKFYFNWENQTVKRG